MAKSTKKFKNLDEAQEHLNRMGWYPGCLIRPKQDRNKNLFWSLGPKPPKVKFMTDENEEKTLEFVTGTNGPHEIKGRKVIMFLGIVKTDVQEPDDGESHRDKEYYTLQFLDGNKVVFWDYRVFDGSQVQLEEMFELVKT